KKPGERRAVATFIKKIRAIGEQSRAVHRACVRYFFNPKRKQTVVKASRHVGVRFSKHYRARATRRFNCKPRNVGDAKVAHDDGRHVDLLVGNPEYIRDVTGLDLLWGDPG